MSEPITFLDALADALQRASRYNKNDQVPPAAVLWPDRECQWEPLMPRLRERLPLLTLGSYTPEARTGPAYWLRCMIAGTLPEDRLPEGATPIIYLPGVSRQDIRAVEECPRMLQPLAELQYRGVLWTQRNGRDWTIAAFLQTGDGGLEIDVGADQATREAIKRALLKLVDEPIAHLRKSAPLRAPFFDALLTPDEVRSLLQWLNAPEDYSKQVTPETWAAFCQVCRTKYGFHPVQDGPIYAAQLLGEQYGVWCQVWERYTEAPHAYPNVPHWLRMARPVEQLALFERSEGWPQDNEEEEENLRQRLAAFGPSTPQEAHAAIDELEARHGPRRTWVWAQLGQAPLARALQHLVVLAKTAAQSLTGASVEALTSAYAERGWQADNAALEALAAVESVQDVNAVEAAIRALYRPWLEAAASMFQERVAAGGTSSFGLPPIAVSDHTCVVFSDALRFDAGRRLVTALESRGYDCKLTPHLAALPTVTATAKPALSSVAIKLCGQASSALTPSEVGTGSALTAESFRKLLAGTGYQVLHGEDDLGDPSGKAWTETGAIDVYGHQHGAKIAHHISGELRALEARVEALLEYGWQRVMVITDHGWLMLPGGLPKANLPEHLTVLRKGRCARLKPFSDTDQQTVPWFWDHNVRIAIAPGICCYQAGKEYEHGGLSPQECIVPIITVTHADVGAAVVSIEQVAWRGLRCTLQISGASADMAVDIRTKAGDAASSLVVVTKAPESDGTISLLVEDEDHMGEAAFVVVVRADSSLCTQTLTTIGG